MNNYRILVPVSFSASNDEVLNYAGEIALYRKGHITCLYVIEKPGFITGNFISKELQQQIRREAEYQLSSMVNDIFAEKANVHFELIVTSGKVYRKILEKASELNAKLIVMGRSDSPELAGEHLGSNASKVIARSSVPVLSLDRGSFTPKHHLLLPLDLSNHVSVKIAKAIEYAQRQTSRITVLTILHPDWIVLEPAYRKRLKEIRKLMSDYEIECGTELVISKNSPSQEIISMAGKNNADLILIMTHEEPNLTEMFLGATARGILSRSGIPVLSITPGIPPETYPYKTLFGSINNPISWLDYNEPILSK